jgi:hypothetical protein
MSQYNGNSPNEGSGNLDDSISNNRIEESQKIEQAIEEKELSKKKLHIAWRRGRILEMLADGRTNQTEMGAELKVSDTVIGEDIQYLKAAAKERIRSHLQERLPFAFEVCLTRLEKTKREAIEIYNKTEAPRIKLQALALINDTATKVLDLITHNDTILTAMNLNNRLDKRVDILLKQVAAEKEELEHKDMKQNSAVITVTTEENSEDDSERSESDNDRGSEATESDSTTTDDTAEQGSRVF